MRLFDIPKLGYGVVFGANMWPLPTAVDVRIAEGLQIIHAAPCIYPVLYITEYAAQPRAHVRNRCTLLHRQTGTQGQPNLNHVKCDTRCRPVWFSHHVNNSRLFPNANCRFLDPCMKCVLPRRFGGLKRLVNPATSVMFCLLWGVFFCVRSGPLAWTKQKST